MCRIAAYLGSPIRPAQLIYDAPHGLEQQACVPKEMISGTVNVDGTGVAWWQGSDPQPLRYVTGAPPWADANLSHLTARLSGHAILAAVRSATPGIPGGPASVAPFVDGDLALAHNGYLSGFDGPMGRHVIDALPDDLHARLETRSDSLALFLRLIARRREQPDEPIDALLGRVCTEVAELASREGLSASLTFVACDGHHLAATRCAVGVPANTLHILQPTQGGWPAGGVLIASETLDSSPEWTTIPEDHRVLASRSDFRTAPL